MTATQLVAVRALTSVLAGMEPSKAAAQAVEAVGPTVDPAKALALLWKRVRNPLEEGAYSFLEGCPRGTGVHGLGHTLAEGWFPTPDRRRDGVTVEEAGELVGGLLREWFLGGDE